MHSSFSKSFSDRLDRLVSELRSLDHDLKSNPSLSGASLRGFRQALDDVRMTVWTVSELFSARESQKDPQATISFLNSERLRRLSRMVNELCGDLEHGNLKWPAPLVRSARESLNRLCERLDQVAQDAAGPVFDVSHSENGAQEG